MRGEFYNLNDTLKISHLVVNGCSYTYGQGIENPLRDAWPSIVARELGVPLINLGIPGQGNPPIQRRTFDYFFQDLYNHNNPFYIHAYTQSARQELYIHRNGRHQLEQDYCLLDSSGDISIITTLEKEALIQSDDYHYYLLEKQKFHIWASINALLDSYNINHMSTNYMPQSDPDIRGWLDKNAYSLLTEIETHPSKVRNFNMVTDGIKKTPCLHETEEGHQIIADYVLSEIKIRYKTVEVIGLDHAKLNDILIHSPHSTKIKNSHIENGETLREMIRHYPREWARNIYYLQEMGIELTETNWMGKPQPDWYVKGRPMFPKRAKADRHNKP